MEKISSVVNNAIENNRIAAIVLLGSALLVLNIFPILFRDLAKILDSDIKPGPWYYTLDMFAMLVRIDIIFTTIAVMAQTSDFCSLTDRSLGWSMFCTCSLVGIAALIITGIYSVYRINDKKKVENKKLISMSMVAILFFLSIALMLYILADNEQPIDCEWNCDSYATNMTSSYLKSKL